MRRIALLTIVAAALIAACGPPQSTDGSMGSAFLSGAEEEHYNRGVSAYRDGDYVRAEEEFDASIASNSNYLAAHLARGQLMLDLERYAEARESFDIAVSLRSRSVTAQLGYARSEFGLNELDSAQLSAESAVDLAREQDNDDLLGESLGVLGAIQMALGDEEGATATLEESLSVDATNVEARVELARLYVADGRNADAIRLLGRADSYQQDTRSRLQLGELFFELGIYDRAIEVLQLAHEEDDGNDDVLYVLGASHLGAGNRDLAIQLAGELIQRNPAYLPAYVVRGRGELQRGYTSRAREDANTCLGGDPNNYRALVLLGDIYAAEGNLQDAQENYERAITVNPIPLLGIQQLAELLFNAGDYAGFAALVEPEMDRTDRPEAWLEQLIQSLENTGQTAHSLEYRSELANTRPHDFQMHFDVARAALDNPGSLEPDVIVTHAQRAFEESGGSRLNFRLLVIEALANAGRVDDALQITESALDAVPNNPELREWRDRLRDM